MISFKILSESVAQNMDNLNLYKNDGFESYLYGILEFNDKIHSLDIDSKIKEYRLLKEDSINESNNVMLTVKESEVLQEIAGSNIKEKIMKVLNAIIDFIKKFINMIMQRDLKVRRQYTVMRRKTKAFTLDDINKENNSYTFVLYHCPSLANVDPNRCRSSLVNITSMINKIAAGEDVPTPDDSSLSLAYKGLIQTMKYNESRKVYTDSVSDNRSFQEYVKANLIYITRENIQYKEWKNSIKDILPSESKDITNKLANIKKDLEDCRNKIEKATIVDPATSKAADIYLSQIRAIISSYTWYLNQLYEAETKKLAYICNTYNKINNSRTMNDSVMEYGLIHGEKFDSDTLFDNEDMNDFNRTEWLNLGLTTECYQLKYELDESLRRTALKEANIMVDADFDKINRLIAMREAEDANTGNKVSGVFASIKKIIAEFFQKIKEKLSGHSKFFQSNKQFIEKEFKINKVVSTGDIFAGIARVQKPLNIVPFNYESMKEDLKDKRTFFEKTILPTLKDQSTSSKRKVIWDNNMTITDYCKCYFGASMPKEKNAPCVFDKADLDMNKANLIAFLNNPKVIQSINTDLNKLEAESKKVVNSQQTAQTSSSEGNNNNPGENKAVGESYFSVLYNAYITEADIEMQSGGTEEKKDATPADAKQAAENNGNDNSAKDKADAIKVYVDTYKDVLMSKLTAAEFIINEGMQIIMAHAKSYMPNKPEQKQTNQQPNQNQNQPQA